MGAGRARALRAGTETDATRLAAAIRVTCLLAGAGPLPPSPYG